MPNYTVEKGDTLSVIAACNGINISDMTIINAEGTFDLSQPNYGNFKIHQIYPGDKITWKLKPLSPDSGDDSRTNVVSPCARCRGHLKIKLVYGNDSDETSPYMINSKVLVGGKVTVIIQGIDENNNQTHMTGTTNTGIIEFQDVKPGKYTVTTSYADTFDLVKQAQLHIGETNWKYDGETTSFDGKMSYPVETNKCNLFIYDIIEKNYTSAPSRTYWSWSSLGNVTVPSLAGDWASSSSDSTENWQSIDYKDEKKPVLPGSILAIGAQYEDATGHVSVIAYPEDGEKEGIVTVGMITTLYVVMQGKTISASSNEVVHNNWGFRTSGDNKKTSSLNSPNAFIKVKQSQ